LTPYAHAQEAVILSLKQSVIQIKRPPIQTKNPNRQLLLRNTHKKQNFF